VRFLVAQPGPSFSVADVYAGWVEALRNLGQQVFEYNLDDRLAFYGSVLLETEEEGRFKKALTGEQAIELAVNGLYAAILKTRPHILLVISAFFTGPELLHITRSAGVKVVVVHTESPYEDDRQLAIAHHADLNLVNDKISLDTFREISRAEYFPQAYRPSVHYPGFPQAHQPCDFAWVGTGFPSRVEFFEAMDLDGIDVALGGNWKLLDDDSPLLPFVVNDLEDCFDNTDAADLYRAAKVGLEPVPA
jgi:spore maturation protein CgeB